MKSLNNYSMMQLIDRYKNIIGEDFEEFVCSIMMTEETIDDFKSMVTAKVGLNANKKEREKATYAIIRDILEKPEKDSNDNSLKKQLVAAIMLKYPERIESGMGKEMREFILDGEPISVYHFPGREYSGTPEHLIVTRDEPRSIDSIHNEEQRRLFKSIVKTIAPTDLESIIKPEYKEAVLSVMMKEIAKKYFVEKRKMPIEELKKIFSNSEEGKTTIKFDDENAGEEVKELLEEYIYKNFHLIDKESILMNAASRLMLGIRLYQGEKINNISLNEIGEEESETAIENSVSSLKRIYRELKRGKYEGIGYKIVDDDGEIILRTELEDIEKFISRCTENKYISDTYINQLRANLENGVFPENLEELKIAGIGLEEVTNILKNYEQEEDKEKKEKLLTSANALVKYLLRNSDVKKEDVIDLYINGNANLELIKTIELDELQKEYFDTRFVELFGEDVYLDTPESNAKLKRYGNLYSMLKEQNQIDTTTDDLVEKLSTMFGEEFIPNIMGELYKIGVANIEEALQWLGGEFLNEQYKQENLKPVEIRNLYDNGIIKHDELISMIKLLKDNTEKFMVISSLFPEQESIDIRQELSERCLDLGEGAREDKGGKRRKRDEKSKEYNKYITDPVSRFMLMKLLDKEYSFKMTLDGHAVMYLPEYEKVIIEKMLDKNGKPYYGAATYVLDADYFERNKSAIVETDKIRRGKLSRNLSSKSVEKLIHSATGWGKGMKEIFGIKEETKTPEELNQIEEAIKAVEESRTRFEGK